MKILVIGSGGREHALCWKIAKSPRCEKLYCAPGNGGISEVAEIVNINADDIQGLLNFAKKEKIGLTIVGPEMPLVNGIVDIFTKEGLKIFGPTRELASIEGSKVFAKELMKRFGVPTADFRVFDDSNAALKYLDSKKAPIVVKADGLCAGKGVIVCDSINKAKDAVKKMLVERVFQDAGKRVIIEECLDGEEASIIVISDGTNIVPLASSQDHKRVYDNDRGPNTGGMGAYSPAPVVTEAILTKISDDIINPIIKGLAEEHVNYKGVLYAGIMITKDGPRVLEFNVRFGDPETQAIIPRLKSDLVDVIEKSIDGKLENYRLEWDSRSCVSIVIASGGYPGDYDNGMEITGLDNVKCLKDVVVFHAGTKLESGQILTSGGRVLTVAAMGGTIAEAREKVYANLLRIHFDGCHYRKDIADIKKGG